MPTSTKRVPKYKTKMRVLESGALRGECSCTWVGNAIAQTSGISAAMTAVQSEIQAHKHIPKPKKVKKCKTVEIAPVSATPQA